MFERGLRNIKEARGVYKRAYSRRLEENGQYAICMDWLRFEQEEGSADDYFAAATKIEPILEEIAATAAKAADPQVGAVIRPCSSCT